MSPGDPSIPTGSGGLEREVVAVYERHSAELLAYAVSIVASNESARDAVQEAFLRYFIERRYGRSIDNGRAWLYRVVRNLLLDHLASASFRHEVPGDGLPEMAGPRNDPESQLLHCQAAEQVTSALTPREMECLRLRAEELSYEEIAGILGIRPGTVSALLSRVHKKLQDPEREDSSPRSDTGPALWLLFRGGETHSA